MYVIKYENKQKEWHPATKPLMYRGRARRGEVVSV
jgi:hypothetical protein